MQICDELDGDTDHKTNPPFFEAPCMCQSGISVVLAILHLTKGKGKGVEGVVRCLSPCTAYDFKTVNQRLVAKSLVIICSENHYANSGS